MRDAHSGGRRGRLRRLAPALAGVAVVAALAGAATAATSKATAAPTNSSPPSTSGTFQVGETVTATTGSWTGSPTSYAYQWQRCNTSGSGCADIAGATASSYTLVAADVDHTMVVVVTAANSDGKASASSKPSPVVSDTSAPRNTARPAISGTAKVGETLTVSNGTWTGGVRSYAYAWETCDKDGNNCEAVSGATAPTYGVRSVDAGGTVRAVVTASNTAGDTAVDTDRSATVQAVAAAGPSCSGTTVAASALAAPIRLQIDRFQFTPAVVRRTSSTLVARYHVSDTCGRSVIGAKVWSTAIPYNQTEGETGLTGGDGWVQLTFRINPTGFPANPGRQQLLDMLVRAVKPGGSVLAGVSARRIVTARVNLH